MKTGRERHVQSRFMKDSLLSDETKRRSSSQVYPLMPDVAVVHIGGKLIDGGRSTLMPVIEEVSSSLDKHRMIIGTGSGKRSTHVLAIGEDLGLPVGILAELGRLDTELNAHIVGALLSPYGVAQLAHAEMIHILPGMLEACGAVVFNGVPPYDLWEHLPEKGTRPPTGSDVGVFLFALTCGMKRVIYLRDVDGIFDSDPKSGPSASLIRRTTASDLLKSGPETYPIDQEVFRLMQVSRSEVTVSVVNGTVRGSLRSALEGAPVGTLVTMR